MARQQRCSMSRCSTPTKYRDLCATHYQAYYKVAKQQCVCGHTAAAHGEDWEACERELRAGVPCPCRDYRLAPEK